MLAPTPPDRLVDSRGRPYFLWDEDMTLATFRERLRDPEPDVRAYFLGKLMRQAKPDDVFSFVSFEEIQREFGAVERYLGKTRDFWVWVLERTPIAEAPTSVVLGDTEILVETRHQILVNKLCALLSRSELTDLVDVRALVEDGGDLTRALADAPNQDGGFSPLTFSWALNSLAIARLAKASGWTDPQIAALEQFRDELVERVLADARKS
jgi:hypothetical protein